MPAGGPARLHDPGQDPVILGGDERRPPHEAMAVSLGSQRGGIENVNPAADGGHGAPTTLDLRAHECCPLRARQRGELVLAQLEHLGGAVDVPQGVGVP